MTADLQDKVSGVSVDMKSKATQTKGIWAADFNTYFQIIIIMIINSICTVDPCLVAIICLNDTAVLYRIIDRQNFPSPSITPISLELGVVT